MTGAECMGGPRAPTPQRCSAGYSVYRQCAIEGHGSEIHTTPNHDTGCSTSVAMHSVTIQQPLTKVSNHSNVAGRNRIRQ
ncbi:hypothetical protein TNCV_3804641 [Trichonephila clavipes]|nr:hypothetical protein TNCV_3804641 [Trichonephila clavipes]